VAATGSTATACAGSSEAKSGDVQSAQKREAGSEGGDEGDDDGMGGAGSVMLHAS